MISNESFRRLYIRSLLFFEFSISSLMSRLKFFATAYWDMLGAHT